MYIKNDPIKLTVCVLILATLASIAGVISQRLWRKQGAVHILRSTHAASEGFIVAQEYAGDGLNTAFLLLPATKESWKWYPLSYDDLYWNTIDVSTNSAGEVVLSRKGRAIAHFDPVSGVVNRQGVIQSPTRDRPLPKRYWTKGLPE